MLYRTAYVMATATALWTTALAAQDTTKTVQPGMTEADVRARWGDPAAVRTANQWTYLFYHNGRERAVGTYDVVFLQNGQVVDAIVRGPEHVYGGQSSSPEGRVPGFTPPQQPADASQGAVVTGVRVKPSP
jgi:hypothetical protein